MKKIIRSKRVRVDINNRQIILIASEVIALLIVVGLLIFLIVRNNENSRSDDISINSEIVAKIDPTNYEIDEDEKNDLNEEASKLLASEEGIEAVYKYFDSKINGRLGSGDTDGACVILWTEYDFLIINASIEDALAALLRFDDSKLVKYQKIYLYRHIVSASVMAGDVETENKYTALVQELDTENVVNNESVVDGEVMTGEVTTEENFEEVPAEEVVEYTPMEEGVTE